MWVTQAGGPAWLQSTGLALDEHGFIRSTSTCRRRTTRRSLPPATWRRSPPRPLEKAGVFAVRMGPPLANNLRRSLRGQPLAALPPPAALAGADLHRRPVCGGLARPARLCGRLGLALEGRDRPALHAQVHRAARHGAARRQAAPASSLALSAEESRQAISAIAMRCGGCGAKVGASILSPRAGQLQPVQRDDVLIGLHAPDDAAVVRVPPGKAMVHTVDFFRAFIDDPYLFGKVAANHALGDIFAMGAEPQSATAMATVPPGLEAKVEDLLLQMMTGAVEVLNPPAARWWAATPARAASWRWALPSTA
jgi:selenide, water dikinase